ncbi:MAG TPA: methylated-DNA--[protein]-cysteine S-methyltransferase [bacterium]|nr:methylated-DNA--[protein]-cysteine S-methyltransferase [bacterium]
MPGDARASRGPVPPTRGDIRYARLVTPIGPLLVAEDDDGLAAIHFENGRRRRRVDPAWREVDDDAIGIVAQLREYFAGTRWRFQVRLSPQGTPFQRRVWQAVAAIPFGQTRSYGSIAAEIGAPNAVRAVGAANGQNPWPIVVPCHRVIGSDGSLTGYGGGLPIKRALLDFERGGTRLFTDPAGSWMLASVSTTPRRGPS